MGGGEGGASKEGVGMSSNGDGSVVIGVCFTEQVLDLERKLQEIQSSNSTLLDQVQTSSANEIASLK